MVPVKALVPLPDDDSRSTLVIASASRMISLSWALMIRHSSSMSRRVPSSDSPSRIETRILLPSGTRDLIGASRTVRTLPLVRHGAVRHGVKDQLDRVSLTLETRLQKLYSRMAVRPGLNRYLRVTPGGLLRIDAQGEDRGEPGRQVPAADLRPENDRRGHRPRLPAAPGSRARLARHEAGHPSRPVYHRKEERIRAHVILCWLALLLARIAENACGATWPELRRQLDGPPSAPSPAPPAPSASAPRSPPPSRPSSTSSASTRPRRSTSSPRPSAADQRKHPA